MTWNFIRAAGLVAYLLLSASTIWGLLLSTKIIKELVPSGLALVMHSALSWLAIFWTALHMLTLFFDSYYVYRVQDILNPFLGPYRPFWVGIGSIAFYVIVITSLSFGWRKRMGNLWWRRLHYLTFLAYIMATLHGLMAGTDSTQPGLRILYWGSGLLVLFLTIFRLLAAGRRPSADLKGRKAAIVRQAKS